MNDYPPVSVIRAGLGCRCPRCGQGPLYRGYLTVADQCSECGLDLRAHDSGDGPAVFIIFILGFLIVPLALGVESVFEPPYWVHVAVWPILILALAIGLLRPMKAGLVAIQFRHRSTEL